MEPAGSPREAESSSLSFEFAPSGGMEPAAASDDALDFADIQSADGHPVADAHADVGAAAAAYEDSSDQQQQQLREHRREPEEPAGGLESVAGAAASLRLKSEHQWSTSTKTVARQYTVQSRNSSNGTPGDVCRLCQKKVYPMELLTSDGQVYHKSCYRCHKCKRLLSLGNFGVLDNQLYCQPHYLEIFRTRGHYQADNRPAEIVGAATVDDGISQVPKLSQLKSRFQASDESPVVVTPPSGGYSGRAASASPVATSGAPATDVVRSGDAKSGLSEELPQPGASKNMLALFRNLEQGGGQQQREDARQKAPAGGPSSQRRHQPYQPEPNLDFDYSAPVRCATESESRPAERLADVVRSGEPDPTGELPPPNFTRSALQMWKEKEVLGGGQAPNPETSERLRSRARETTGVNNNIRLPGAAAGAAGDSLVANAAPPPPPPRDESSENQPAPPQPDVARWDGPAARDGGSELPAQGTAKNLRSMFNGGQ